MTSDEQARGWDEAYARHGLMWHAEPNALLAEVASQLPVGRAIDLGCGEGRNSLYLAGLGWTVTGIDFSSVAVEKARRLASEQGLAVNFEVHDVRSFEPEQESADLVMALYLHLAKEDRRRVLAAAANALSPGGHVLVVGHDVENFRRGLSGPPVPEILFTKEQVAEELLAAGLLVERAERIERKDHAGNDAVDTLVLARKSS